VPWELLQEEQVMLSASADTPFSRYLPTWKPWGGSVEARPIRALVAISNPHDLQTRYGLPPVDVALEQRTLRDALAGASKAGLQVDFLDSPVTLERLQAELCKGYHILHVLGHGAFSAKSQQAALYLQNDHELGERVLDDNLAGMLARQGVQPRLVFLSACQSATRSTADAFLGLGPKLVSVGVPAVVAMQDLVTVTSARKFSAMFYRRLLEHGLVDLAMNEARSTLLTAGRWDAGVPVLFMRLRSGRLWAQDDLDTEQPTPQPVARPTGRSEWNTAAIRELLTAAFDDEEIKTLCFDHFRPVYEDFTSGMGKRDKIQRLVEHCVRHERMEELLALVKKGNLAQYARFQSVLKS